jgi:hypothetical protein
MLMGGAGQWILQVMLSKQVVHRWYYLGVLRNERACRNILFTHTHVFAYVYQGRKLLTKCMCIATDCRSENEETPNIKPLYGYVICFS